MTDIYLRPIASTLEVEFGEGQVTYSNAKTARCLALIITADDALLADSHCRVSFVDRACGMPEHLEKVFGAPGMYNGSITYERPESSKARASHIDMYLYMSSEELQRLASARVVPSSIRVNDHNLATGCKGVVERDDWRTLALTGFTLLFGETFPNTEHWRGPVAVAYENVVRTMRGEKAGFAHDVLSCINAWSLGRAISIHDLEIEVAEGLKLVDDIHEAMNLCHCRAVDDRSADKKLNKIEHSNDQTQWVWRPPNMRHAIFRGEAGNEYWLPTDISGPVCDYLKKPWATCARLEKLLLDRLVYEYALQIYQHVQFLRKRVIHKDAMRWMARRGLSESAAKKTPIPVANLVSKSIFWLAVALGVGYGAWHAVGWWAGALAFQLSSAAGGFSVAASYLRTLKAEEAKEKIIQAVIEDVIGVYELQRIVSSPRVLRERFVHLANEGLDWPRGVFELIEHAEKRNAYEW